MQVRGVHCSFRLPPSGLQQHTLPGAALNSQHIYDETPASVAADTRYERGSPREWVTQAKKFRIQLGNKGGIGRYDRDGFVHIDNRPSAADWHPN